MTIENLTDLTTDEVIQHLRISFGENNMVLDNLDLIIGNPPYQKENAGDNDQGATQIYQDFINLGRALRPKYISMITPSRWFADERNNEFRQTMLAENKLRIIHDFQNAKLCFPTVQIKGGVNYFLWDRDNPGPCKFVQHTDQNTSTTMVRSLDPFDNGIVLRENDELLLSIYQKVHPAGETVPSLKTIISARKPFGLDTSAGGQNNALGLQRPIRMFRNQQGFEGHGWIEHNAVPKRSHWIPLHKVLVPYAVGSGDTTSDRVNPLYAPQNSACSETYLVVGTVDQSRGVIQTQLHSEAEARNLISYFNTRFLHLFLGLKKISLHTTRNYYQFVPLQSWDAPWSDERLATMYGFTREERDYLNSAVWPNLPPSC
jgi:site-specific DNA-methyltransferase (adenine-specific)